MFAGKMTLTTNGATPPGTYDMAVVDAAGACSDATATLRVDLPRYVWDVGVEGGFFLPDSVLTGKGEGFSDIEPMFGLRFGREIAARWRWFLGGTSSDINTDLPMEPRQDAATFAVRTGAERSLGSWRGVSGAVPRHWLVSFGIGLFNFDLELEDDVRQEFASIGAGQRVALDRRTRLRWELRVDRSFNDEGFGEKVTSAELALGLSWEVGRRR